MIKNINTITTNSFIYKVSITNNIFTRHKITKEFEGETWFRYSKPNFEYKISKHEIIGILKPYLTGIWPEDDYYTSQFYIKNTDTKELVITDLSDDTYFRYKDYAEKFIIEQKMA